MDFFDRNEFMNSEGRKILERAAYLIARFIPEHRKALYRVRRDGSLEAVKKLYNLLGCNQL